MDVMFITNFTRKYSAVAGYIPLGILYLSSSLRAQGHRVHITPARLERATKAIRRHRPKIVAFSSSTGDIGEYLELNRSLKREHDFMSVFGGPHPTHFPDIISVDGVDAVCRGEGEEALCDLAERLESGRSCLDTRNFWFRRDGRIHRNPVRPLIRDLDSLPLPDRDLWFSLFPQVGQSPRKQFMAVRGCPYRCTYCFNHKFNDLYENRDIIRRKSVDGVVDEILDVVGKYPTQQIQFVDDTFNLDRDWLEELCSKYAAKVKLPFFCNLRTNLVEEDTIKLLARAGCRVVAFGIESGNEHIRETVLKRQTTTQSFIRTADLLHKYNIRFLTFNMIGIPGETLDNMQETIDLNRRCRPDYAYISIFQPYPTTDHTDEILTQRGDRPGDALDRPEIFPDSLHASSMLPGKIRKDVKKLHRLFALLVDFPELDILGKMLMKLPYSPVLDVARKVHAACVYRKLYGFRLTPSQYLRAVGDTFFKNPV